MLRRTGKETNQLADPLGLYIGQWERAGIRPSSKEAAQSWERAGLFCLLWLGVFPFFFTLILMMMSLLYLFSIKKLLDRFKKNFCNNFVATIGAFPVQFHNFITSICTVNIFVHSTKDVLMIMFRSRPACSLSQNSNNSEVNGQPILLHRGDSFTDPDAHCRLWDYYIPIVSLGMVKHEIISECLIAECLNRLIYCSGDSVDAFAFMSTWQHCNSTMIALGGDGFQLLPQTEFSRR